MSIWPRTNRLQSPGSCTASGHLYGLNRQRPRPTGNGGIMRDFAGKTAFVTGGASGIGFALGRAFAETGMKVMLADIEADALASAVKSLHNFGPDVRGVACDVTDPDSLARAAGTSYDAFGK